MDADHEREFRDFVALRSKSLLHTAYLLTGDCKALTALRVTMRDQERITAQTEIQTHPRTEIEMQGEGRAR